LGTFIVAGRQMRCSVTEHLNFCLPC